MGHDDNESTDRARTESASGDEWGGTNLHGNLGNIIELGRNRVIVTGVLEAGANVSALGNGKNAQSFRITVFDPKRNVQSQAEVLLNKLFIGRGIKKNDLVEVHGYRTERGFIKAEAILNLETNVKTGKLKSPRYWLFLVAVLLIVIGAAISGKEHAGPRFIVAGCVFLVAFFIFWKRVKFLNKKPG